MCDDADFEVAASKIFEQVCAIRDPELATTIEKWVSKLTAENRGANELKYLQLLQYMVTRGRIIGPFAREPPPGALVPLGRYADPPAQDGDVECRRTSCNCGGTELQTDGDAGDGNDDDGADNSTNQCSDGETTANDRGSVGDDRDAVGASPRSDDGEPPRAPAPEDTAAAGGGGGGPDDGFCCRQVKRDGHLAGGGGGGECNRGAPGKNPSAKLCDPCLDDFGRHLLKKRPGPMDAAYRDLLGDCAPPVLTDAERKTVGPELSRVLDSVDDATTLQDFYFQVSLCTCDQGALLMKSADGMVDDFRTFVSDVFESRTEHISDGLASEQTALCEKYAYLYDRTMNRATVALDFLREAMPVFSWHKYQAEPDEYLRRMVMRRAAVVATASSGDAVAAAAAAAAAGPVADDDDIGGQAGGEDDDDGARHSAIKKLLYRINWLRTEVGRVDCEGQRLYEQRGELTATLAELNRRLSDAQCRTSGDIDRHKNELAELRQRSAEQTAVVDRLMDTVQLTMQDKQPSSSAC